MLPPFNTYTHKINLKKKPVSRVQKYYLKKDEIERISEMGTEKRDPGFELQNIENLYKNTSNKKGQLLTAEKTKDWSTEWLCQANINTYNTYQI